MKTRLAFSLIILVLQGAVAGAVYAQENIPETVKRHDQELKDMAEQIRLLKIELDEKTKTIGQTGQTVDSPSDQGFSVYVSPPSPKPRSTAIRCSIFEMTISVGPVEYDFTKIIVVDNLFGPEAPYYIRGKIECTDRILKIPCSTSGKISIEPNRSYGFQFTRPEIDVCDIEPLF